MEPRLNSRGNRFGGTERAIGKKSFNGAAAEQPRKSRERMASGPPHHASMEPRLNSRGNDRCALYGYQHTPLQWSRG